MGAGYPSQPPPQQMPPPYPPGSAQPPQSPSGTVGVVEPGVLRATFDLSFNSLATPRLVKIVYLLAIVVGVVYWVRSLILGFLAGDPFAALAVVNLLLGWIPVLLWIFLVRIALELALAWVSTAEDVRHIRAKIEG